MLGTPAEHALISLLALNGLRVFEATGADVEALGTNRGHRVLPITRKDRQKAVIPLAPRTPARSTWPSASDPTAPSSSPPDGRRLDRHGTARIVRRVAHRVGLARESGLARE